MNRYLHQIAARGAGRQAGRIAPAAPSRFAQRYGDLPTLLAPSSPLAPPSLLGPLSEFSDAAPRRQEQPATDAPRPRAAALPLGLTRHAGPSVTATPASASAAHEPDHPSGAARVDMSPPAPATPRSRQAAPPSAFAPPASASDEAPPRPSASAPPRTPVRLEPPHPSSIDAHLAALLPETGRPSYAAPGVEMGAAMGVRLPPVRERFAAFEAAAPANAVRVSIGRIDVRVDRADAEPAPVAPSRPRAEPDDPFGALALARRGWRAF